MKKRNEDIWQDTTIEARVFFDILETEDLTLLKKSRRFVDKKILQEAWEKIYDEYYELKSDPKMGLIIETKKRIAFLMRDIQQIKTALYSLCTVPFSDEQIKVITEKLKKKEVIIDVDNLLDSVLHALQVTVPSMETLMELEKDNLIGLTKGNESNNTFDDNCVIFESYGFNISENCSLRRYISYEKSVTKKSRTNGKRKVN